MHFLTSFSCVNLTIVSTLQDGQVFPSCSSVACEMQLIELFLVSLLHLLHNSDDQPHKSEESQSPFTQQLLLETLRQHAGLYRVALIIHHAQRSSNFEALAVMYELGERWGDAVEFRIMMHKQQLRRVVTSPLDANSCQTAQHTLQSVFMLLPSHILKIQSTHIRARLLIDIIAFCYNYDRLLPSIHGSHCLTNSAERESPADVQSTANASPHNTAAHDHTSAITQLEQCFHWHMYEVSEPLAMILTCPDAPTTPSTLRATSETAGQEPEWLPIVSILSPRLWLSVVKTRISTMDAAVPTLANE